MQKLSNKKCTPCSGKTEKFSRKMTDSYLSELNNWSVNDKNEMIFKKYKFKNFVQTIKFVNQVAEISEIEGHHPDFTCGWGYCLIMLHTHAIGGLSHNDFILASKIDLIEQK